jgi:molybdopterin/thiamine biosynthesis adenylyltransferase
MTYALLPSAVAAAIRDYGGRWGYLDLRFDRSEDLIIAIGYSKGEKVKLPVRAAWLDEHYSRSISPSPAAGFWYRADPELHEAGEWAFRRRSAVPLDFFRERVNGFHRPHRTLATFVITLCEKDGRPDFAGWVVTHESAERFPLEVVLDDADLFLPLEDAWPVGALAEKRVTVIGIGSIGSAACEALSGYAVRSLALVDPDRLQEHNFARHRAQPRELGRYKVNAVADMLKSRDRGLSVEQYALNVVDDADVMRPLFARSSCILVCSDGVESRRVANHLACHAGVPVVLACVLEDGGFGEVMCVRPGVTACLTCSREQLVEAGVVDPEPTLDLGYGTGFRHLAMTAVGGDLDLVGKFAARAVVSTLLAAQGFMKERLPAEYAVLGLRPSLDREPEAPFDVERSLAVVWHPLGAPKPDCPSCAGTR